MNPSFEPGSLIDELVADGVLHQECSRVFRIKPKPASAGQQLRLHRHQADAIRFARGGHPYVLTTGTGSGKSMAYIVPAVDFILRHGSRSREWVVLPEATDDLVVVRPLGGSEDEVAGIYLPLENVEPAEIIGLAAGGTICQHAVRSTRCPGGRMPRTIVIGDIHGCAIALAKLIEIITPQPDDTVVPLGDYVDREIDSRGVIDQSMALAGGCRLLPIRGNHEEMLLQPSGDVWSLQSWIKCGGRVCLDSYGATGDIKMIPAHHLAFLKSCRTSFETERHFFVHANYGPDVPLEHLDIFTLYWCSLRENVPSIPHCSGKVAIVGHTPQPEVLDLGHLKCIDTGCCYGGWLTALDVDSGQVWQVNERGEIRS